jgi:hypothetical protein
VPLRTRLVELVREKPYFGYSRLDVLLGVDRVYWDAGLMIRRTKLISP